MKGSRSSSKSSISINCISNSVGVLSRTLKPLPLTLEVGTIEVAREKLD